MNSHPAPLSVREVHPMLYVSLVLSLFLLLLANSAVCRSTRWARSIFLVCGIVLAAPNGIFFLPPVGLVFLLLTVGLAACLIRGWGPRVFVSVSAVLTLIAFGIPAWFVWQRLDEHDPLRDKYPLESMEERVPAPKLARGSASLPGPTGLRLTRLEQRLEESEAFRNLLLRRLHQDTVTAFVNSPGFGVTRANAYRPSESAFKLGLRESRPIPQPVPPAQHADSPGDLEMESSLHEDVALDELHQRSVADFVNPAGFGYFKDRRHVAGFQPHQFSETPAAGATWKLQTVELVGLLVHNEPVVYVSAHLPRMEELREAPTRPPDAFELLGLPALQRGDDLFVREPPGQVRLLGAIRAARQCVSCHGSERGDLLGAFSYTLRRSDR